MAGAIIAVIAVVDDEALVAAATATLLRSLGFRSQVYRSAAHFLDAGDPELHRIDCVVTDIHMPGASGLDLHAALARRGLSIPVVLMTGRLSPEIEAAAHGLDIVALLEKPLRAEALRAAVETALARG